MGPRWWLLITFIIGSTVLLLVSSMFGAAGWAVPLLLLNPLLALGLAWWDTARRGFTWWWLLVPVVTSAVQALILLNATAIPFALVVLLGASIGSGIGTMIHRRAGNER